MKEQQVTQILQELAEQEVPTNLDLWPAIQTRLQTQRQASRWARLMPATRLGWASLGLILFLAFGSFFSSSLRSNGTMSKSKVGIPAPAQRAAIPPPMIPEPITATFSILLVIKTSYESLSFIEKVED